VDTDPREIVDELVDFYRPQCELHRVVLRADIPATPVRARVDPSLVKQALLNLLINATQAMAAQDAAAPDATARELLVRIEPTPTEIAIHVIDTGPGIPAEKHREIFRPYVSGRRGGSGLGLAVTRRIVEEHGGRIDLFSEPGKGTDFVVRLPVAGPNEASTDGVEDDDARKTVLDRLFNRAERRG
jgi:signal transduction histidine kinase